jgi:hypothetical protein
MIKSSSPNPNNLHIINRIWQIVHTQKLKIYLIEAQTHKYIK